MGAKCNFIRAHGSIARCGLSLLQTPYNIVSKGVEGLQDIHIRLRFSPPTCHKKENSLQFCPGRYPAFSSGPADSGRYTWGSRSMVTLLLQTLHCPKKPALPVSNPHSDVENDSWKKYFKATRRTGLETEGRVLLFLGKISSGTREQAIP